MILYPEAYFDNVLQIDVPFLQSNGLSGLILDVDNTLIDLDKKMLPGTIEWANSLKSAGIKLCILSNSNKKEKVEKVASDLSIPYFYFGKKPLKCGFRKVLKTFELESATVGVVGDQIMTDIIGARRSKMFPILVKPISEKDIWITKMKRPLEQKIINAYLKKKGDKKK